MKRGILIAAIAVALAVGLTVAVLHFRPKPIRAINKAAGFEVYKIAWYTNEFCDSCMDPVHDFVLHKVVQPWFKKSSTRDIGVGLNWLAYQVFGDMPFASTYYEGPGLALYCTTPSSDLLLVTDSGLPACRKVIPGFAGVRMPINCALVFDVGPQLTNGVYHVRVQGQQTDLADVIVKR